MSTLTPEERHQVDWLLGPFVAGAFLDAILQGILSCQFVTYYILYKDDTRFLRFVVFVLALLTTLKTAQQFLTVWEQSVVWFGDVAGAVAISYTKWWQTGTSLMTATIGLLVQSFFLWRLFSISNRCCAVIPIGLILLFSYIAIIIGTYYIAKAEDGEISHWFAAHLSAAFVGDALLACLTAFYLITTSKDGLRRTKRVVSSLVLLTFQTAAPAAICALLNLIFSQLYAGGDRLISATFNAALPKLYAVSMMWTLNSRCSIRTGLRSDSLTSFEDIVTGQARCRRPNDLAFGRFGAIQVQTEVVTDRRVDGPVAPPVFLSPKKDDHFEVDEESTDVKAHTV